MGNRSRALHRPRARIRRCPVALDGRALSGTHGRRARSDLQPAPARPAGARARRCASRSPPASPRIARRRRRSRRSTANPAPASRSLRARVHARAERPAPPGDLERRGACSSSGWRRACSSPTARCARSPDTMAANELGQSGLWPHGISGDLPILLVARRRATSDWRSCGRCCRRRSTGASRGCAPMSSSSTSTRRAIWTRCTAQLTALLDNGPWRHVEASARRRLSAARRSDRAGRAVPARGGRARGARRGSRRPPRATRPAASGRSRGGAPTFRCVHGVGVGRRRTDAAVSPVVRR